MKLKKFIYTGAAAAVSVVALTGCLSRNPETVIEESKRNLSYTKPMLYIDSYDLDITLDDKDNKLTSKVTADLYNNTESTLDEIVFRLPAAACLEANGMNTSNIVESAYLGEDESSALTYTVEPDDPTVIHVALGDNKLEPSKHLSLSLAVNEDIPEGDMRFGHFEVGKYNQYVLSSCFPQVAEYRNNDWVINDIDWNGDKYSADTRFAQATDYHADLHLPNGYKFVGTGVETNGEDGPSLDAVDVRELALVASSGQLSCYWSNDKLTVSFYYEEGAKGNETAQEAVAGRIPTGMDWMEDNLIKYPWNQYDIVNIYADYEAHTFPGMMVFGSTNIYDGIRGDEIDDVRDFFKLHFTETLFDQWFAELIGSNEETDGWLSKGLSEWLHDYLRANAYGDFDERKISNTVKDMRKEHPDAMNMKLTDKFPDGETADLVNTYRGAEFIEEVYQSLGEDKFFLSLKEYVNDYAYSIATTEDFLNIIKNRNNDEIQTIIDRYF